MTIPTFSGIDHFHLYADDLQKAVQWYEKVLGFHVVEPLLFWNHDNKGPLTIEDQSATIHLALFKRTTQPPSTSIAFKTDGASFIQWKKHLEQQGLDIRIADHQVTWSMYFRDPDDNLHEITTDAHDEVRNLLKQR